MKLNHRVLGAAVVIAAAPAMASTGLATSTFANGAQGWRIGNGVEEATWLAVGGQAGGYIQASDASSEALWFFNAPTAFLGDASAAYGGWLSYSLRSSQLGLAHQTTYADVQLLGANSVLLVHGGARAPGVQWTSYRVPLLADGTWLVGSMTGRAATEADFAGVLANLSALRIRGDYKTLAETTGLDSVALTSPVPEPVPASLAAMGLLWLAAVTRHRR